METVGPTSGAADIMSEYIMDKLNKDWLTSQPERWPSIRAFSLPEKVLQFGTGVLLRGLPDYFIDRANQQGLFNGRIAIIKSTSGGDLSAFQEQDGLYTLCVRGIKAGREVHEDRLCAPISRVLSAQVDWPAILEAAQQPTLELIISNTTEVGLSLLLEDINQAPPSSFPGKLTALLHHRWVHGGSGLIIIPTELVTDNGNKLLALVQQVSEHNHLDHRFLSWLQESCIFCNSLVDRIVPGHPQGNEEATLYGELGYEDKLAILAEDYRLWAIEGNEQVHQALSFAAVDPGVIIAPDITKYRELKLRLLNGTHTFCCGIACLAGLETVRDSLSHPVMGTFIEQLMLKDIAQSLPEDIAKSDIQDFGQQVLDRFRNPYVRHLWINITLQYASKMRLRNLPLIMNYYRRYQTFPDSFALGLAAFLRFMRVDRMEDDRYFGQYNGSFYPIKDDQAGYFLELQQNAHSPQEFIHRVLESNTLWGGPIRIPGLLEKIRQYLEQINGEGMLKTLQDHIIA